MQLALAAVRVAYFENPMRTAISLIWFRLQTLDDSRPEPGSTREIDGP